MLDSADSYTVSTEELARNAAYRAMALAALGQRRKARIALARSDAYCLDRELVERAKGTVAGRSVPTE